jgi:chromosome transmission fidelity protein 1
MEIQKTAFKDDTRVISLSSRKNLCINDDVLKLGSDGRISDRCLDMQKGKTKKPTAAVLAASSSAGSNDPAVTTSKKRPRAPAASKQTTAKCPFLPSNGAKQQTLYRDHALSQIRNLEDLAELGKKLGTCSYYGTRRALAQAEVICMPYATLLHKGTRESMKIPLKGNVVLVDEAHNLVEAINAVHTSQLSLQAMSRALSQVTLYWERYNTRLSGKNAVYVQQVIRVLKGLVEFVRTKASSGGGASGGATNGAVAATAEDDTVSTIVMSVNELVFEADMDNVNLFKLVRYMEQSQIAKKVLGFADRRLGEVQIHGSEPGSTSYSSVTITAAAGTPDDADENAEYVSSHVSSLQIVQTFLTTLTGSNQDGRIVLETGHGPQKGRKRPAAGLKYIMLNAAVHFREIVAEARSVVLVGGTMQPVAPIVAQLFPDLSSSRLDVFSCGHVIPPENLTSLCVSKGPTGVGFDFTHKSRVLPEQMDELGRLLLNVCTITPGGVVVFLPSYGYEEMVVRRWRETGLLSKLQTKKAIFTEPKRAKDVDAVLHAFSAAIASNDGGGKGNSRSGGGGGGGAILFCVVGAKMSEGINFADDMARCVVMVGLPYPDRRDPELQQKLQYLDSLQSSRGDVPCGGSGSRWGGGGGSALGPVSGKIYYQNLCMRAVNQSIGRAIRHANDWAAIVLVDRRYFMDPSILPLLPNWIADRVVPHQQSLDFRQVFVHLSQFVRNKAKGSGASEKE